MLYNNFVLMMSDDEKPRWSRVPHLQKILKFRIHPVAVGVVAGGNRGGGYLSRVAVAISH